MRRMRGQTKQHDVKLQAKVIKLFPEMDYGFLETPDGREIYFNRDSVLDRHFDRLRIGSAVHFAGELAKRVHGPPRLNLCIRPSKRAVLLRARSSRRPNHLAANAFCKASRGGVNDCAEARQ